MILSAGWTPTAWYRVQFLLGQKIYRSHQLTYGSSESRAKSSAKSSRKDCGR